MEKERTIQKQIWRSSFINAVVFIVFYTAMHYEYPKVLPFLFVILVYNLIFTTNVFIKYRKDKTNTEDRGYNIRRFVMLLFFIVFFIVYIIIIYSFDIEFKWQYKWYEKYLP